METELRQQIGRAFDNNKLIGNHEFSNQQYSMMLDLVSGWHQAGCDFTTLHPRVVFATLVEIAKRWKDSNVLEDDEENSGFWHYVTKIITGKEGTNQKLYLILTKIIGHLERNYGLTTVREGHRYYATLMMHAFAPRKSIYSFFDLCYNVFKADLNFGFTSDDEWLSEIVAEQMRSVLGGNYREDKLVSIGSSAYSINVGLRSFVLHEDLYEEFDRFTKETFYNINRLFNREMPVHETRVERFIVDWWKNKTASEKPLRGILHERRIPTVTKQNIIVRYIKDGDEVLLCVPSIRLDDANSDKKMQLAIYADKELAHSEDMRTKRGELVFATKQITLSLNKLIGDKTTINIRVEITEDGTTIFDSGKSKTTSLLREFILFDDDKEIFSHINKPTNYFIYSLDIDALKQLPKELVSVGRNLYNIYPSAGESLEGATKQVFFVDGVKTATIGRKACLVGEIADTEWVLDDIYCSVYKNAVKLMVPENSNLKALELRIDNHHYKLDQLDYEQKELGCYQFGLKNLGLVSESYPTQIALYSYGEDRLFFEETLIILPNLEVRFNQPFYFGADERRVIVENGYESHEISLGGQDSEVVCSINDGSLVVKIPRLRWRINDGEWRNEPIGNKLWYRNFLQNGDLLEIDNPQESSKITVFGKIGDKPFSITKNVSGKFELGRTVYANEGNRDIYVLFNDGNKSRPLFIVATKEHFVSNPVVYRDGKIHWEAEDSFIGDDGHDFFLIAKANGKNKNPIRTKIGATNIVLGEFEQCPYTVTIKIKDDNLFARDEKWDTIYEGELIADDNPEKYRFSSKKLTLLSANCHNNNSLWIPFLPKYYIDQLRFVQEGENIYYTGRLCEIISDGKTTVLDTMVNKKGEVEKINPVRIELRDSTTFWLVAGYEGENDFVGELFLHMRQKEICNIQEESYLYNQINLYKFKEEYV
jgi:hypothetical protein